MLKTTGLCAHLPDRRQRTPGREALCAPQPWALWHRLRRNGRALSPSADPARRERVLAPSSHYDVFGMTPRRWRQRLRRSAPVTWTAAQRPGSAVITAYNRTIVLRGCSCGHSTESTSPKAQGRATAATAPGSAATRGSRARSEPRGSRSSRHNWYGLAKPHDDQAGHQRRREAGQGLDANQTDLVDVVHRLKQVVCVKG